MEKRQLKTISLSFSLSLSLLLPNPFLAIRYAVRLAILRHAYEQALLSPAKSVPVESFASADEANGKTFYDDTFFAPKHARGRMCVCV